MVECQPFYANVDAPLLRFVASLLKAAASPSSAAAASRRDPEAHHTKEQQETAQSSAMGVKLFLTGSELVLAEDLRLPTSLPIQFVLHQLFVSTHMDTEFELLLTKPPGTYHLAC
jgi:hypothetical protein